MKICSFIDGKYSEYLANVKQKMEKSGELCYFCRSNLKSAIMKFKLLSLLGLFLVTTQAFAQLEGNSGSILVASDETQYRQVYKSRVPVWLNLSAGGTIADCYDNGTIPFSYLGIGGNLGGGVTVEWRRCHIQSEGRLFSTSLSAGGSSIGIDGKTDQIDFCDDERVDRRHGIHQPLC